jgi:hypothetical protein
MIRRRQTVCLFLSLALPLGGAVRAGDTPMVAFKQSPDRIALLVGNQPVATYVFRDERIPRPYFAHVHAPGGIQVTRNHLPIEGKDLTDHATFHPGLWLAFGDVNGADHWRLKALVKHIGFAEKPRAERGQIRFAVTNQYLANDGKKVVCTETARYTMLVRPSGYLLLWDSEFRSDNADFSFGDQEEMGLGIRVATALIVKNGGEIRASTGEKNEKNVRGKAAPWCDFSGTIDGRRVGITLMPDPANFRPSWYHARDYGLLVANPFGRKSLTGGEASRIAVKRGEPFRLRFGVLLHSSKAGQPVDMDAAYRDCLQCLAARSKAKS